MPESKHCPELKTRSDAPENTFGFVRMERPRGKALVDRRKPIVDRGEYTPAEGEHLYCTAAIANRTLEGVPVLKEVVEGYCERVRKVCPILTGERRLS